MLDYKRTIARNRRLAELPIADEPQENGSPAAHPRRSVTVNLAESPLAWLRSRGLLTARQCEAGERLRGDWTRAGLAPRVTMRWDAGPRHRQVPGAGGDPTLSQIDSHRRFDAAIAAAGAQLSDILWRVACAGEGLEAAERQLGWPKRAGKLVLQIALDRLADHYRLP